MTDKQKIKIICDTDKGNVQIDINGNIKTISIDEYNTMLIEGFQTLYKLHSPKKGEPFVISF